VAVKTAAGWVGVTDKDNEILGKMRRRMKTAKIDTAMRMEWTQTRDIVQHRKLFALFNLITENSETYDTIPKVLVALKLCTGHFDMAVDPTTGEIVKVPNSISFEAMEQGDFDEWYARAVNATCEHIIPQIDSTLAYELLDEIVQGWVVR
jgi:hypothetical protein